MGFNPKRTLVIISFLMIISNSGYSQWLNFNDLKYIYSNDIESVDSYLTKKGFEFLNRDESKNEFGKTHESTTWYFKGKGRNNTTFIAKSCDSPKCGISWYQLPNLKIYTQIRDSIKKQGFKLQNTNLNELGDFEYIYSNREYQIKFSTEHENDINTYFITFSRNFIK